MRWREALSGFAHGLTFYPWPCVMYRPFAGRSGRWLAWYFGGLVTAFMLFITGVAALIVFAAP